MAIRIPPFLKPGDKIGIVAPAGAICYPEDILPGMQFLSDSGFEIVEGRSPSLQHFQFAGTDAERLSDLQEMLDHPEIRAIIAVRGGYGCSRIIDILDFTLFREYPKWLVGFSDLTLLLCHLEKLGFAGIHGPMVKQLGREDSLVASGLLLKVLSGEPVRYETGAHPLNREGKAQGRLTGGNLCLLAHGIGSASETGTRGKILFLEDVGEPLYNLDRMLWQLSRAGKLKELAGLMAGRFTENKGSAETFGMDAYEIVFDHVKAYRYPLAFSLPVGHVPDNRPLVIGKKAVLEVGADGAEVSF